MHAVWRVAESKATLVYWGEADQLRAAMATSSPYSTGGECPLAEALGSVTSAPARMVVHHR